MKAPANPEWLYRGAILLIAVAILLGGLWQCDRGHALTLDFGAGFKFALTSNEQGNLSLHILTGAAPAPARHRTGSTPRMTLFGFGWRLAGGFHLYVPYWMPITLLLFAAAKCRRLYIRASKTLYGERCRNCGYDLAYRRSAAKSILQPDNTSVAALCRPAAIKPKIRRFWWEFALGAGSVALTTLIAWFTGYGYGLQVSRDVADQLMTMPTYTQNSVFSMTWIDGMKPHEFVMPPPESRPALGIRWTHEECDTETLPTSDSKSRTGSTWPSAWDVVGGLEEPTFASNASWKTVAPDAASLDQGMGP